MIYVAILLGLGSTLTAAMGGGESLGYAIISTVLMGLALGLAHGAGIETGRSGQ